MPALRLALRAGRGEHDRVAEAHQHRAVGLLRHPSRLDAQGGLAQGHLRFLHAHLFSLRSACEPGRGSLVMRATGRTPQATAAFTAENGVRPRGREQRNMSAGCERRPAAAGAAAVGLALRASRLADTVSPAAGRPSVDDVLRVGFRSVPARRASATCGCRASRSGRDSASRPCPSGSRAAGGAGRRAS